MFRVGQNFAEGRGRIQGALNFPQSCPLPPPWEHVPLGVQPTLDFRITPEDARGWGGITQREAGLLPGSPVNDPPGGAREFT